MVICGICVFGLCVYRMGLGCHGKINRLLGGVDGVCFDGLLCS